MEINNLIFPDHQLKISQNGPEGSSKSVIDIMLLSNDHRSSNPCCGFTRKISIHKSFLTDKILDQASVISGDEVSILRILKRQKRLSPSKAADLTGFEIERCRMALESLRGKKFVQLESSQYWITQEGEGYLAFSRSIKNP